MHIFVAPASPKTGAATIQALLQLPDLRITGLYRDPEKAPADFISCKNFEAVQGDVAAAESLDFTGADAVLAITPPAFDGRDVGSYAELVSANVRDAIEEAGSVKRLVLLSSVGAQFSSGVGEIKTNHIAEAIFSTAKVPEVVFVRCAYFMENWTLHIESLKGPEPSVTSAITPLDWKVPMVSVKDIGSALANELTKEEAPASKPHVFELHGPQPYTPLDVQADFSIALGRQVAIKPVEKKDLPAFFGKIFPSPVADEFVEMTISFLPGGILAEDKSWSGVGTIQRGKTGLLDVFRDATARIKEEK